jgi:hypothetical protein
MTPQKVDVAAVLETPENKARIAKFEKMAAQEQASFETTAKLFNPTELMRRATEIREFNHPQLGLIRFGELTIADSEIIRQCTSDADKTAMAVYLMLKKAYPEMPTYTPENISGFYKAFPVMEGAVLLQFVSELPVFLQRNSATGSEVVGKLKKLA